MFKNLTLYRIGADWRPTIAKIEEALQRARFLECRPTQDMSVGWTEPRGEKHGALVEAVAGQWLLRFAIETRLLPASVIRREVNEKLAEIEATTGRKPGRLSAKEIREQVVAELLPRAFTKQAAVNVWIDPKARLLAIDTTAKAKLDEVLTGLIRSLDGLAVTLVQTRSSPGTAMAQWLAEREAPGHFDLDRECELKSTDDNQSAVRYSRHALDIAEIRKHVEAGKMPTRLGMLWTDKLSFVLTDTMQVKKIRFLDGVLKEPQGEDDDRFDADAAIVTGTLARLVPELIEALGGEAKSAQG